MKNDETMMKAACELNLADATENACDILASKRVPIVLGPPGLGKTSIFKSRKGLGPVARAMGYDHVEVIPCPTYTEIDMRGYGSVDKERNVTSFNPPALWHLNATKPTLLVFDDAPAVTELGLQKFIWAVALDKVVAGHTLPDCVDIAVTGNRATDFSGAVKLLEASKTRFSTILVRATGEDARNHWLNYAMGEDLHIAVIAYVNYRAGEPERFYNLNPQDITNTNPRTLEMLSDIVQGSEQRNGGSVPDTRRLSLFCGTIGTANGADFAGFYGALKEMPMPQAVLANPDNSPIPNEPGAIFGLTNALAVQCDKNNAENAMRYLKRFPKQANELVEVFVKAATTRKPELANECKAIQRHYIKAGNSQAA